MSDLRISSIEIRNVRGIKYLKMDLSQITIIRGQNSSGKTSIVQAFRSAFKGSYDPTIVRDATADGAAAITVGEPPVERKPWPETKARIVVTLNNGTTITRTVNKETKKSEVECLSVDGEKVGGGPQEYLDELLPVMSFDPVSFIRADKDKRQEIVMEFLDVPLSREELSRILLGDWWEAHYDPKQSAFPNLDRIENALVQRRRDSNRQATEIEKTINNLRKGIPSLNDESKDWKAEAETAEKKVAELIAAHREELQQLVSESHAERQATEEERRTKSIAIDTWLETEMERLAIEAQGRKKMVEADCDKKLAAINEIAGKENSRIDGDHNPKIVSARMEHQEAKIALAAWNNAIGVRKHLAEQEEIMRAAVSEVLAMDKMKASIIDLRKKKMESTPIPGLSMRDGIVFYDGLMLDAINTAQQIAIASQIAAHLMNEGRIPFMVLDNAEALDAQTRADFIEGAKQRGMQVVIAEVEESPLRVEALA